MKVVVADTSPINYLVLIGKVGVLQSLYNQVLIPRKVFEELTAPGAPSTVADWTNKAPDWITVVSHRGSPHEDLRRHLDTLDAGEVAAIAIALSISRQDSLLLMDDFAGRSAARELGMATIGTLGILVQAARKGLLDLRESLTQLRDTNFRVSDGLIAQILREYADL